MEVFLIVCFALTGLCTGGSFAFVHHMKKPKHLPIDYKKINRLEMELGLGHSDFGAKGLDMAKAAEEEVARSEEIIRSIDRTLHPERKLAEEAKIAKGILNTFAIPSHMMGPMIGPASNIPARFDYPAGDQTYHGPHGLSCPCAHCFGEIDRRSVLLNATNTVSDDIVADLRRNTYIHHYDDSTQLSRRPLPDPLQKVKS